MNIDKLVKKQGTPSKKTEEETMISDDAATLAELLKDLILINSVIATELVQLVENSSRQLRGDLPESCATEHGSLKEMIVRTAEKWSKECEIIRNHNLKHD